MCVFVCVKWDVRVLEVREECSRTLGMGWNSSGYKQMQSGNSSRSRHNREVAVEADAIGEQQLCTENCLVPDYSRWRARGESSPVQSGPVQSSD